jgi:hypothetical protein
MRNRKGDGQRLCRRREVLRLTGWSDKFLRKLVECGVVKVWRPTPGSRLMYYRASIQQILDVDWKNGEE